MAPRAEFLYLPRLNGRSSLASMFRMKTFLAFLCVWLSAFAVVQAGESAASYAADFAVNVDVQAAFFARFPDLTDEEDIVMLAARNVAAEPPTNVAPPEAVAAQARKILAQRTPQEWQHKAVTLFPELGVAGSDFNNLFLKRYHELQTRSPQFTREPSWPVLLARRCADELGQKAANPAPIAATPVQPDNAPVKSAKSHAWPGGFWISLLNLILLAAVLIQPAFWLFRCSRAFAGNGAPLTLWQHALRPAAWGYFAATLLAVWRTFPANADEAFFDRFGITLLVSLLTGIAFAIPTFVGAMGYTWWRTRTAAKSTAPNPQPSPAQPVRPRL